MIFLWFHCFVFVVIDLKDKDEAEKNAKSVAIPLLMRNKLPVKLGESGDEKLDVTLMPDQVRNHLCKDVRTVSLQFTTHTSH